VDEINIQELVAKLSTELELLKSKDIRDIKDVLRMLSGKIDRLTPNGEQSATIAEISTALAKAKLEKLPLKESGAGNRGKYSTLEDYEDAYEKPLAKFGLSMVFTPQMIGNDKWVLVTKLTHSSGEWFRSVLPIEASESGPIKSEEQGLGSSISYMKRYSYAAMMGV
jgi:hypothetical protein